MAEARRISSRKSGSGDGDVSSGALGLDEGRKRGWPNRSNYRKQRRLEGFQSDLRDAVSSNVDSAIICLGFLRSAIPPG